MRTKLVNGERINLTPEENSARDLEEADQEEVRATNAAKNAQRQQKLSGVDLGGIMASATKSDQDGLTAVSVVVIMARAAGSTFEDTNFEFANGSELLITDSNFDGYFAAWSVFRQSFFKPEAV
jgi:hypothetical protein|tara:strand:+ start:883 stop:1254 length:372 start_codon:yes stop_codon:yes gene_type:complete